MRFLVGVAIGLLAGCGGAYDTQCDGPSGIDCSFVGRSVCTSSFGDRAPHAFCTDECATDSDCESTGRCVEWKFPRGERRVCVATYWLH